MKMHVKKLKRDKRPHPQFVIPLREIWYHRCVMTWCGKVYPRHKRGCPKFGAAYGCPPNSEYVLDVIDFTKPVYIVYNTFDLAAHMRKMEKRHPEWSDAMLRNVLYWQPKSRKGLNTRLNMCFDKGYIRGDSVSSGEHIGVNLYATCRRHGLQLDRIAVMKVCHHMVVVFTRKRHRR